MKSKGLTGEPKVTLGILLLILLTNLLYSNILDAPFVFDDASAIKEKDVIRDIQQTFGNISNNRYIIDITFALNYAAGSLNPFGYHLVNNMIHAINAILVFFFIRLTLETPFFKKRDIVPRLSNFHLPFFSALFFATHPIQTQAVTYIAQRSTSMATMFYLLSLISYAKWRSQTLKKPVALKHMHLYILSIIFAAFAMKTKEIAFTLPAVAILYEFLFFSKAPADTRNSHSVLRRLLFLIPLILTMLIIPLSFLNLNAPAESLAQDLDLRSRETTAISRETYLFTEFRVIMTYLKLLFFPVGQSIDHTYALFYSFFEYPVLLSFTFLFLLFCSSIYLICYSGLSRTSLFNRTSRLIAFGILWFFVTLSVESSIIPIRDVMVEHRLYLPSIGIVVAFLAFTNYLVENKNLRTGLLIALIAILSINTYSRNNIWKNPESLWSDVLAKAPDNARAHNNLGVVFKDRGEFAKAIEHFNKSLTGDRNYTAVYFNLGDIQYRLGNHENAVSYLTTALTSNPDRQLHLDILNKLGRTYSAAGDTKKAIQTFQRAIQVMPSAIAPYNNLAVQYIRTGQFDLAIEVLQKALTIREEPYLLSNLSIAYSKKNNDTKISEKQ